ncbi:hypothetical protein FDUTEX481_06530 [Tolypothrix sp. PCC 7601]|nr:hypothetical protein FDUTEX481_06530 [Tolypothrix sp. PCC 7601]
MISKANNCSLRRVERIEQLKIHLLAKLKSSQHFYFSGLRHEQLCSEFTFIIIKAGQIF